MTARVELRIAREDLKRWRVTAAASGLSLSEWMRRCCNDVALPQWEVEAIARNSTSKRRR